MNNTNPTTAVRSNALRPLARMGMVIAVAGATTMPASVRGDTLSDSDRQLLLERLEKLQDAVEGRASSRIGVAVTAYRNAVASPAAALDFYLKCIEKVDFEDQHRKGQDFRDWKRQQGKRLDDPGLGLALQHQLNWLVLTLEAADKPERVPDMAPRAARALEAVFGDAAKLARQQALLRQSVLGTVFARAYEVSGVDAGEWPDQPLALGQIFDKLLMPPLRNPAKVNELRDAWLRRIQYEAIMREGWSEQEDESDTSKGTKIGMKDALRSPAYDRFLTEELPNLRWRMEEDLFKAGDQRGAALRMLEHLEKFIAHRSAVEWAKSFVSLVNGPQPVTTSPGSTPPAPTTAPPPSGTQ